MPARPVLSLLLRRAAGRRTALSVAALLLVPGLPALTPSAAAAVQPAVAAAAVSDESVSEPAAEVLSDGEVPSLRTERSKTFVDKQRDGYVTQLSAAPLHVRDDAGSWRPIEPDARRCRAGQAAREGDAG